MDEAAQPSTRLSLQTITEARLGGCVPHTGTQLCSSCPSAPPHSSRLSFCPLSRPRPSAGTVSLDWNQATSHKARERQPQLSKAECVPVPGWGLWAVPRGHEGCCVAPRAQAQPQPEPSGHAPSGEGGGDSCWTQLGHPFYCSPTRPHAPAPQPLASEDDARNAAAAWTGLGPSAQCTFLGRGLSQGTPRTSPSPMASPSSTSSGFLRAPPISGSS